MNTNGIKAAAQAVAALQEPSACGAVLREVAQQFREDAANLRSTWQDDLAGRVWVKLADQLDRCADRCDVVVTKEFA